MKLASIDLHEYWMGRDVAFPPKQDIRDAACTLLWRVNSLLARLRIPSPVYVSSGYRPGPYNVKAHGALHSPHLTGEAIDLWDRDGALKMAILGAAGGAESLLASVDLWMERPANTPVWVHLDTRVRPGSRIFIP